MKYVGNGCPICKIVVSELDKKKITYEKYSDESEEGQNLISESGLKSFPILKKDNGEFVAGQNVLVYVRGL